MDNIITSEGNENNRITVIEDKKTDGAEATRNTEKSKKPKRTKKEKARIPWGAFAIFLVICMLLSSASGAGSSLVMFRLINLSAETEASENDFIIEDDTTVSEEDISDNQQSSEDITFMPDEYVSTEAASEEVTTEKPALTKGEIYADAVNSIFAINATWNKYTNTMFGTYTQPVTSTGTGFAISANGYIVTNHHVVESSEDITVTDYNGKKYTAKLVGTEPSNDFAVIKIDADTTPVTLGDSSSLTVGDDIIVIGNALGQLSYTFTDGIVSHLSRNITVDSGETIHMFQTNAAINKGNSGGPVYNMDGEVVGIASAKFAADSVEGLGFCIPIDDVKTMLSDIIIYGYVTGKPSLGVTLQTVTSSMSSRYSIPTGCYIVAIDESSGAYLAGLRNSAVITKMDRTAISSCEDMKAFLADKSAGDSVSVTYTISGTSKTVTVILGEYKPSEPRTGYSNVYDF